jgi:ribosome-binding protein aMBF1 (putative translation factor)
MDRVTRGPTVAEWLGMDATEEAVMELAVVLAKAIRRSREAAGLTQAEFASKIGRSQSAVAKAECGQVSIGRMVSIYLAAGGRVEVPEVTTVARGTPL